MAEIARRDFLKLVGVSAGGVAASGCAEKVEQLIPYVVQPEEVTPGKPVHYASTCTECSVGCGILVKTRESRPIKLEGNPEHPINRGALCSKAQASVGRTYSPDRFKGPMKRDASGALQPVTWAEAIAEVAAAIAKNPSGTHLLGGDPGDTAGALVEQVAAALGAKRTTYLPFSGEALREATRLVFGVASEPLFDLSGADLVLDFGAESLESGPSPVEHQRQWAAARDIDAHAKDGGARLVYVGSRLSLTASSADQWLAARPGSEGVLALALARAAVEAGAGGGAHAALLSGVLAGADAESAAKASDVPAATITKLGQKLAAAKSAVALPPGVAVTSRRAVGTAAAVLVLNQVLGAVGRSVTIPEPVANARSRARYADVLALTGEMKSGRVSVLLVHHANPAYSLPKATGFAEALAKVGLVVSFANAADETTAQAHLVLPDHAPLESWGDVRPRSGVRGVIQPSFRPLYDTRAFGDSLLEIARKVGGAPAAALPGGDFRSLVAAAWVGGGRAALQSGGVFGAPTSAATAVFDPSRLEVAQPELTGSGGFTLLAVPHVNLSDGRGAALGLLQEIPDAVTHVLWESWAEISNAAAAQLGVETGDILSVTTSAGALEVAAYVRGGIRDDVIAIPTGQGHTVGLYASKAGQGLAGTARGVNVADLLSAQVDERGGQAWLTEKAEVANTGRHRRLPMLQFSDNKRGRQLGEVMTLAALNGHHDEHGGEHHGSHEIREPYDPAHDAADAEYARTFQARGEKSAKESPYRWGLTVDLDKCTGCSACITACYVENNIPVVGEDEIRNVRPMTWLRIDRWIGDGETDFANEMGRIQTAPSRERLGDVDVRNAPIMCQHCGAAPCEPVCPVIATYHNEEGLNGMIYNRCIGTRYCANNCPYKVRRYNYFDNQITKWPSPMELGLNPDVTVRGQGVMEKCTFCVQRVQYARQEAKSARGVDAVIADGAVQTACQQTCPSGAITFGNLRDDESAVSKKADSARGYHALHVLNTRPAVTYLSKVVRGPAV
jgi:molybdopterin-containing oxidoreductase family iron-sulfur binding subunit